MKENIQFYLVSALIAFIFSCAFWKDEELHVRYPVLLFLIPAFWFITAPLILIKESIVEITYLEAMSRSLDVKYFLRGRDMVALRAPGVLAMFSISFFFVFFRCGWFVRNRLFMKRKLGNIK